jgi:ATP-dependent DNA helicase PIF1
MNLGEHSGNTALIPRIKLTPSDSQFPFELTRLQFPVQLSFAMTINKSQGQTLSVAGLYLPKAVFTHGQLYVALSRVGTMNDITVFAESDARTRHGRLRSGRIRTKNIVFREVLINSA